jgi:hypothetical protein
MLKPHWDRGFTDCVSVRLEEFELLLKIAEGRGFRRGTTLVTTA